MIHIYYGNGKGKTSAAIGAGIRACGHGKKVILIRFLKTENSGEVGVLRNIPNFQVLGRPDSIPFYFCADDKRKEICEIAENESWEQAKKADCDMLILDEFLDVVNIIGEDDALEFLKKCNAELIITGHCRNEKIFAIADYISEMKKERHPFDKGCKAREGIEF